jgi:hypothetical protein
LICPSSDFTFHVTNVVFVGGGVIVISGAVDDEQLRLLALGVEAVAKLEIHRRAADISVNFSISVIFFFLFFLSKSCEQRQEGTILESLTGRLDAHFLTSLFEERFVFFFVFFLFLLFILFFSPSSFLI